MITILQENLARNMNMLREVQKVAHLGSWEMDLISHQVTWSEEAFSILGIPAGSIIPSLENFLHFIHPDDKEKVIGIINSSLISHKNYSFYCRIVQPGGKEIYTFGKGTFELKDNVPVRLYGIIHDTTEFKAMRDKICLSELMGEEHERERFSRELHDGLGQMLTSIALQLRSLGNSLGESAVALNKLKNLNESVQNTIQEVRSISHDMSPSLLKKFGLRESLENILHSTPDIEISFKSNIEERIEPTVEIILFRAAQEFLSNIIKHSGADKARFELLKNNKGIILKAADNGIGNKKNEGRNTGLGMENIKNRVSLLNGSISIPPVKKGFTIEIFIPYKSHSHEKK
ncbi:MAG: sensor histidine kinase [Bacteroidia bacterium]